MILIKFKFNGENLIFKEVSNEYEQGMLVYGLFRYDGTRLGTSICNPNKYKGDAWYLDNISIFPEFERKGYGSKLLEITCQILWEIKKIDIVLERPGDNVAPDGFDRKKWYEKHGFESAPGALTFMFRKST